MTSHRVFTQDRTISFSDCDPKCTWRCEPYRKYTRFKSIPRTPFLGHQITCDRWIPLKKEPSNADNVSIWLRHHECVYLLSIITESSNFKYCYRLHMWNTKLIIIEPWDIPVCKDTVPPANFHIYLCWSQWHNGTIGSGDYTDLLQWNDINN